MSKSNKLSLFGIIKILLLFTALYAVITALLILVSSLILFNTEDPLAYISITSKGISLVSSLITGFVLAKKQGEKYLLKGLVLGVFISCLLLLVSLFIGESGSFNPIIYIATLATAAIGALLGRPREKRKKVKHKRK